MRGHSFEISEMNVVTLNYANFDKPGTREAEYEGEIDPHTPLFINITYTKKRPSFRQNSWCAKGRIVPCLGVLIRQYCRRFIPPSLYSLLDSPAQILRMKKLRSDLSRLSGIQWSAFAFGTFASSWS